VDLVTARESHAQRRADAMALIGASRERADIPGIANEEPFGERQNRERCQFKPGIVRWTLDERFNQGGVTHRILEPPPHLASTHRDGEVSQRSAPLARLAEAAHPDESCCDGVAQPRAARSIAPTTELAIRTHAPGDAQRVLGRLRARGNAPSCSVVDTVRPKHPA
jgi:hypothetical protein